MKIGEVIRKALKEAGKTQVWLAEQLGVTQKRVSRYVNASNLELKTILRIHSVLPLDLSAIIGEGSSRSDADLEQRVRMESLSAGAVFLEDSVAYNPAYNRRQEWAEWLEEFEATPPELRREILSLLRAIRKNYGKTGGEPKEPDDQS